MYFGRFYFAKFTETPVSNLSLNMRAILRSRVPTSILLQSQEKHHRDNFFFFEWHYPRSVSIFCQVNKISSWLFFFLRYNESWSWISSEHCNLQSRGCSWHWNFLSDFVLDGGWGAWLSVLFFLKTPLPTVALNCRNGTVSISRRVLIDNQDNRNSWIHSGACEFDTS